MNGIKEVGWFRITRFQFLDSYLLLYHILGYNYLVLWKKFQPMNSMMAAMRLI